MITKAMIDRINFLYHKRVSEGLTPEEQIEEKQLRKDYLAGIRAQVEQTMANIEIVDADGEGHEHSCNCGEHHHHHGDCCHGGHGNKH